MSRYPTLSAQDSGVPTDRPSSVGWRSLAFGDLGSQRRGCPTLDPFLFLWLGWDRRLCVAFSSRSAFAHLMYFATGNELTPVPAKTWRTRFANFTSPISANGRQTTMRIAKPSTNSSTTSRETQSPFPPDLDSTGGSSSLQAAERWPPGTPALAAGLSPTTASTPPPTLTDNYPPSAHNKNTQEPELYLPLSTNNRPLNTLPPYDIYFSTEIRADNYNANKINALQDKFPPKRLRRQNANFADYFRLPPTAPVSPLRPPI